MRQVIMLSGLPGTGKSTVGKRLSEKLPDFNLIDYDRLPLDERGNYLEIYLRLMRQDATDGTWYYIGCSILPSIT